MNPTFNNIVNPVQEHITSQEINRKHNNKIGFFLIFGLGILVGCLIMKYQTSFQTMEEET